MIVSAWRPLTLLLLLAAGRLACADAALPVAPEQPVPQSFVSTGSTPPPGFEDLAQPQITQVDVYFAGRLIASPLARYDLTTIEFLDPAALVSMLQRLLDPPTIERVLSGPLAANADQVCASPTQRDCGKLSPPVAAVLFDESRFRIDLFIDPLQLEVQTLNLTKYLPASSARDLSTMHMVNVSLSGGGADRSTQFNIGTTSLFAVGESRVHSRYDIGRDGLALSELSWQHDLNGWEYEGGVFRSFGRSVAFVNEQDLLGFRMGRSLNTRTDLDSAEGTPIFLFLNQSSRVDILRDGRLIDSHFYDSGNQQLDTTQLPDGAYEIELRTLAGDGREERSTYFFVRTTKLPPAGEPMYFAEWGVVADTFERALPALDGGLWLRIGGAKRVRNDFGFEAALLHAGSTTLVEGGGFWFGPGWQLHANLMTSGSSDIGASFGAYMRRDVLTLGIDYRVVRAGDDYSGSQFDPISGDFSQGTINLSMPLLAGRLAIRAQSDQRDGVAASHAVGINFSRRVYRGNTLQLDLDFDTAIQDDDSRIRLGLSANWRRQNRYASVRTGVATHRGSAGTRSQLVLDARSSGQRHNRSLGKVTDSVFAVREEQRAVIGAGITSDSDIGRSHGEVQYVNEAGNGRIDYAGNSRFSVTTQSGNVAAGGRRSNLSAVVIAIEGDQQDGRYQVLVDRRPVDIARVGRRTIVGLPPFGTYQISLKALDGALAQFDDGPREVTLYPGNVQTLVFAPKVITVIVGQALRADGSPLGRARFNNVEGYGTTDASGWFQIEVSHNEPLELTLRDGSRCALHVSGDDAKDGLLVTPARVCEPLTNDASDG